MRSHTFWTLTCLLIVLATALFSGRLPAASTKPKTIIPKILAPKILAPKVIISRIRPKPAMKIGGAYYKIGGAYYVLVKIGKPYIDELYRPANKK